MKKVFSKFGAFIGKKKKIVIPVLVTVAVLLLLIAPIKKVDVGYQGVLYSSLNKENKVKNISPGLAFCYAIGSGIGCISGQ